MKYWLYFYMGSLYAYTDQSDYRKKFEEYRDMSKFKVLKKDLNNLELKELYLNYSTQLLVSYNFKMDRNIYIEMIITKEEQLYTINNSVRLSTVGIFEYCWTSPKIFNKDIREALHILKYDQCNSVISGSTNNTITDDIGVDDCEIEVDEFAIFMQNYSHTFKDKY